MRIRSLSTRLLASVGVVMVVFFGAAIFLLDGLYRNLTESSLRSLLESQLYVLVSASDEQPGGRLSPGESLREARFATLGSGLYGQIDRDDGQVMWRSESMTGAGLELGVKLPPGEKQVRELRTAAGATVLALSTAITWEFPRGKTYHFVYTVAENMAPYRAQLQRFRQQLIGGFSALMLMLLAALAMLFRWVLNPVRKVEQEIEAIEAGLATELGVGYPRELEGITTNMNALLRGERERVTRYRNTLGNLAHSLKTPLAVVRSLADSAALQEQVTRMDEIVSYQLKRAALSGGTGLGSAPIEVRGVIEALQSTLLKVYADKGVELSIDVQNRARFNGDQGDLMEIAGNLLDNACKFCRRQVKLSAEPLLAPGSRREGLLLVVEDDGPGIAPEQREHVLKRGARLDERIGGQGIGLSVVNELSQLSGGSVDIGTSQLGGSKITVRLPAV
jgi:two-component system, OmpR family, sensor histidine kinase PhoQ